MTEFPLVSILTPSMNSSRHILQTLLSIQTQTYPAIEHIVVDGGSTDGTVEILRGQLAGVQWVSAKDRGQSDALNKALKLARGEIIGWLNADDTYEPHAIRAAVGILQGNPKVDLVFGACKFIDADGREIGLWPARETRLEDLQLNGCVIPHQTLFLRRRVFERVGFFDVNLHYVMDYDFLLRALRQHVVVCVNDTWGSLRVWEGTKTSNTPLAFWPEIRKVLAFSFAGTALAEDIRQEAWRRFHLRWGVSAAREGDEQTAAREFHAACSTGYAYGSVANAAEYVVGLCQRSSYLPATATEADISLDKVLKLPSLDSTLKAHLYAIRAFRAQAQKDWRRVGGSARRSLIGSGGNWRNRGLWMLLLRSVVGDRWASIMRGRS